MMAHCAWSSDGGWVVMRCSQRPGAVIRANSDPRCLAANRMISYETPAITGSNTMRMPNLAQNVVTGNTADTAMYTMIEISITVIRKLVPQRGWNVEYFCTDGVFSGSPFSNAYTVLCSAP